MELETIKLVRVNRPQEAIGLYKMMLINDQRPNFVTVLSVIKAVGLVGSKDLVCGIHGYSMKTGFLDSQVSIVTALVGVYSNWDMEAVRELFDCTTNKDVILCSAMVSACATIASIIPACADLAALKLGKKIHAYSIKNSLLCHAILQNSLVDMYSKCRRLEGAIQVFEDNQSKDLVSWRIMIRGCVENESLWKAVEFFNDMRACSVEKVDECIIQEVIGAYSQLDENYVRQGFISFVLKNGFTVFASVVTELLQLYAKFGDIEAARNIFDHLKRKDVIAWSAMISVYSQSTRPESAFDIIKTDATG